MGKIKDTLKFLKGEKEKEGEKPKRGHYHERECPYCHIPVRNLPNHIRMKHPTEAAAAGVKPLEPVTMTKETLLTGKKPPVPEKPAVLDEKTYYCQGCRAVLRRSETACWNCGATLKWEGIE